MAEPSAFHPSSSHTVVGTTLEEHILGGMRESPGATGDFTSLLNAISLSVRIIHSRVRAAGLAGLFGYTGDTNVHGEQVQKLDEYANDVLCTVIERSGRCAVLASEELEEARMCNPDAKYMVAFDPLDGSSNIDVNVSIGTIFSIFRAPNGKVSTSSLLLPGRQLVCAGYAVYGSATTLVLSVGQGVHEFTLDLNAGEFFLSRPNLKCPARGKTYSINEGNFPYWTKEIQRWSQYVKTEDKAAGLPMGHRYVGSLVADAHRTLIKGGIFAYPSDRKTGGGKLRLLYEAQPMAFLMEQADGLATDGERAILDIVPSDPHAKVPLILGSREDVLLYQDFASGKRS